MYLISAFSILSMLSTAPVVSEPVTPDPATYILQVTSNLGCSNLNIELVSSANNTRQYIKFTTGAFAAAKLSSGSYHFGEVICTSDDGVHTFDVLKDKIAPFSLSAGQTYFAGRLIFEESENTDANNGKEVYDNCTRIISRARGESNNECRDGTGPESSVAKQVSVYIPKVDEKDITAVRTALSATKDQLVYLPFKV